MIDPEVLAKLIQLRVDNELSEMDLRDGEQAVALKRAIGGQVVVAPPAPVAPAPAVAPGPAPAAASGPASGDSDEGLLEVSSPMVGTFYSAPDPESPAFVTEGSRVGPESVVCIVEAMKVFSEIKAEVSGVIERVLVKNGEAVEFGQKLFLVRPE